MSARYVTAIAAASFMVAGLGGVTAQAASAAGNGGNGGNGGAGGAATVGATDCSVGATGGNGGNGGVGTTADGCYLPHTADYVGNWVAQDTQTDGLTRLHVRHRHGNVHVALWGACGDTECEIGDYVADRKASSPKQGGIGATAYVVHAESSTRSTMYILTVSPDKTLTLQTLMHFAKGTRHDSYTVERFVKG